MPRVQVLAQWPAPAVAKILEAGQVVAPPTTHVVEETLVVGQVHARAQARAPQTEVVLVRDAAPLQTLVVNLLTT